MRSESDTKKPYAPNGTGTFAYKLAWNYGFYGRSREKTFSPKSRISKKVPTLGFPVLGTSTGGSSFWQKLSSVNFPLLLLMATKNPKANHRFGQFGCNKITCGNFSWGVRKPTYQPWSLVHRHFRVPAFLATHQRLVWVGPRWCLHIHPWELCQAFTAHQHLGSWNCGTVLREGKQTISPIGSISRSSSHTSQVNPS